MCLKIYITFVLSVSYAMLFSARNAFEQPRWGPNLEEFIRRFDAAATNGEGPNRLMNMYFAYLVEMRALVKAAPYLMHVSTYLQKLWHYN